MAKKVTVIPANPTYYDKGVSREKTRVAAYCRVSTDQEEQLGSFANQVCYYQNLISSRPDWELVDIFADEGISGTGTKMRNGFMEMIKACNDGKIEISLPKWIQSHKSETALKPLEIRHFTAFAPSSAALGEGRFSVLCG